MKSKLNRHYSLIASVLLTLALMFSGQALAGDIELTLPDTDGTSAFQVKDSSSNVLMKVQSNGNVGIGNPHPNYGHQLVLIGDNLLFNGSFEATGDIDADKLWVNGGGGGVK